MLSSGIECCKWGCGCTRWFSMGGRILKGSVLMCMRPCWTWWWGMLAFAAFLELVSAIVVAWYPCILIFCSFVLPILPTLWTFSSALMLLAVNGSQKGLAYSSTGRTNAMYAVFLSLSFVVLMFCLRKPKVLLALLQTSVMWASQQRSAVILTPRYFSSVSVPRVWPWSWYCEGRTIRHLVMFTAMHFFPVYQAAKVLL